MGLGNSSKNQSTLRKTTKIIESNGVTIDYTIKHKLEILSLFEGREELFNLYTKKEIYNTFEFIKRMIIKKEVTYDNIRKMVLLKVKSIKLHVFLTVDEKKYLIEQYEKFKMFGVNH